MEYSNLYGDVNQLSLRFQNTEFSEVMVVHRMHLQLGDLNIFVPPSMIEGSEKVKRLYVVADVVELPSSNSQVVDLPATISVIILCRILYFPDNTTGRRVGMNLSFLRLRLHVVETSEGVAQTFAVPSEDNVDGSNIGVYIHADRFIFRPLGTTTNSPYLIMEVVGAGSTFSSTVRPNWPDTINVSHLGWERLLSKGSPLTPSDSDLQRSDEIELLAQPPHSPSELHGRVSFQSWDPVVNTLSLSLRFQNSSTFNFFPLPAPPHVPADVLTHPSIILGMQMNMLIAELVLAAHNSPPVINVVTKHVEWLNKILLQVASPTDDILALLFRVQAFMKTAKQPRFVVPRLQYHMYSSLINRMVQVAQNYDQEFRQLKLFIAQNEILGSYLLEQNRAFADKEKDMSVFYSQVVSMRRSELNSAIETMDRLSLQMGTESEAMNEAKDDMVEAIQEYERKQLANALFAVLGAIASVALAFATGGATAPAAVAAAGAAVNAAGRLAQGLQRVVEILEGLQAVMEIVAAIRDLVESLENMGQLVEAPEMPEMPTNADWLIFVNEVEAVAEQVPTEVTEVSVWKAKCKNVAVLGREMCTTAAHISELQYQITVEEMLQEIAQRQADRLVGISTADLSSYTEMASQIDMRTTRMLLELIKMLYIQNAAIKYEHLYAASGQLNSWPVSMQTVWSMLLQQENAALLGLLDLGPSNDFIVTYVVKDIPVKLLVDGYDWHFEMPVEDFATFPAGWSRVRIRHVELKFDQQGTIHQPSTNTGLVYMLLQSSSFLHDRKREEVMEYEASMGLSYAYAYNLSTGAATLTNIPSEASANTFMQMTPFTAWRLRLSASAMENQGLVFPTATSPDDTTQISITFYVTAIRRIDTRQQGDVE